MSSLHYFANRYRNRVSRKREFFNLYKTVFVILNMQKSHKISLFKILQLFYHVASQTSSIFTCNICTKSHGLFSGYFLTAYALRTVILLAFWRSFQRVPWQTNSKLKMVKRTMYGRCSKVLLAAKVIYVKAKRYG